MNYIIYFIITIAILVFVHEFGHFIAAKLSKMRADVFAIGFGKRLFGWNKITGFTFGDLPEDFDGKGNTDYRLCALPLGGYVKIAGMVDESFDVKFADKEPQPYEFRSKPTYQKLFVILAGVLMNLLLAFVIYWGVHFFQEKQSIKTTTVGYIEENSPANKAGFQQNDKILSVNQKSVDSWEQVINKIFIESIGNNITVKVLRDNNEITLNIPRNTFPADANQGPMLSPAGLRIVIDSVLANTPADKAGIQKGDVVLKIKDKPVFEPAQLVKIVSANPNKEIAISVLRSKDTLNFAVTPDKDGRIGVYQNADFTGKVEYVSAGFFEAVVLGISDIGKYTKLTFQMIGNVINGHIEFSKAFGGPVKIAQFAAKSADTGISAFIYFLAMLSLSLAILNILPFPVLDGGHFVIILIEGIMKREIPVKVKVAIQNAGFVILLLFMAFIIYNDIVHL